VPRPFADTRVLRQDDRCCRAIRPIRLSHRNRIDARVENDIALMQALQGADAESARILHEAVRHLTDRLFAFRGGHRDVVPYGILREVGHDLVQIQAGPGGEQVANHLFTIDRHRRKSAESTIRSVLRCHKLCEIRRVGVISIISGRMVNGEGLDAGAELIRTVGTDHVTSCAWRVTDFRHESAIRHTQVRNDRVADNADAVGPSRVFEILEHDQTRESEMAEHCKTAHFPSGYTFNRRGYLEEVVLRRIVIIEEREPALEILVQSLREPDVDFGFLAKATAQSATWVFAQPRSRTRVRLPIPTHIADGESR